MQRFLQVPELEDNSLLWWQKLATQAFTMQGEGRIIQIRMNKVLNVLAALDASRNLQLKESPTSRSLTVVSRERFTI